MSLHKLRPAKGSVKRRRRVARGIGSGLGKTAGRGTKGQKARRQIHPGFEGGQTPIHRRLPVKKGFRNVNHKEYAIVNIKDLETLFTSGEEVNPETLHAKGLIPKAQGASVKGYDGAKILGFGDLSKKLKVSNVQISASAAAKVAKAGGEVVNS